MGSGHNPLTQQALVSVCDTCEQTVRVDILINAAYGVDLAPERRHEQLKQVYLGFEGDGTGHSALALFFIRLAVQDVTKLPQEVVYLIPVMRATIEADRLPGKGKVETCGEHELRGVATGIVS